MWMDWQVERQGAERTAVPLASPEALGDLGLDLEGSRPRYSAIRETDLRSRSKIKIVIRPGFSSVDQG
jgi:hypothetical protein